MNPALEIVIPVRNGSHRLLQTAASLTAQTDRRFAVLLSDDFATTSLAEVEEAQQQLSATGIAARRLRPPRGLKRLEHWNWAHAQSRADWLKMLLPGEELKPGYVEKLGRCLEERPHARFVRCDVELRTDWGPTVERAPFAQGGIGPAEVADYFPHRHGWLARSLNIACARTAWLAIGGYAPQFPACAVLNFNVIQALHYGVENLAEPLALLDATAGPGLNSDHGGRVNSVLEMWLILRQARNYCLAARLPWPKKWLLPAALGAAISP